MYRIPTHYAQRRMTSSTCDDRYTEAGSQWEYVWFVHYQGTGSGWPQIVTDFPDAR